MMQYAVITLLSLSGWILFVGVTLIFDKYGCDYASLTENRRKARWTRRIKFGKAHHAKPSNGSFIKTKSPEEWERLLTKGS